MPLTSSAGSLREFGRVECCVIEVSRVLRWPTRMENDGQDIDHIELQADGLPDRISGDGTTLRHPSVLQDLLCATSCREYACTGENMA